MLETMMKMVAGTSTTPQAASPSVPATREAGDLPDFRSLFGMNSQTMQAHTSGWNSLQPFSSHTTGQNDSTRPVDAVVTRDVVHHYTFNLKFSFGDTMPSVAMVTNQSRELVSSNTAGRSGANQSQLSPDKTYPLLMRTDPSDCDNDISVMEVQGPQTIICSICFDKTPSCVLHCRHAFCEECVLTLFAEDQPCAKCRAPFFGWEEFIL